MTKSMIVDGVEYIEEQDPKDTGQDLCDGCAFVCSDTLCSKCNKAAMDAFGGLCWARGVHYIVKPAPKTANCPRCKARIRWDWCQDAYRIGDGDHPVFCNETEEILPDGDCITRFTCTCGKILGFMVGDNEGSSAYNHSEFDGIDWEEEEHSEG